LRALRRWLEPFEVDQPSEDVLEQYRRAIQAEQQHPETPEAPYAGLRARPSRAARRGLARVDVRGRGAPLVEPPALHGRRLPCRPVPRAPLRIVMQEGDANRHVATGSFIDLRPRNALSFELAPLDGDGVPLFSAVHDVRLARHGTGTRLSLTIRVTNARPKAARALAGMHLGWNQLLDNLAEHLPRREASHEVIAARKHESVRRGVPTSMGGLGRRRPCRATPKTLAGAARARS
jgi:hypothetical protein